MFLPRFLGQLCKEILRLGEQLVPSALGFQLKQNQCSDSLLVLLWELCRLSDRLLQKSAHNSTFYTRATTGYRASEVRSLVQKDLQSFRVGCGL